MVYFSHPVRQLSVGAKQHYRLYYCLLPKAYGLPNGALLLYPTNSEYRDFLLILV